MSSTGLLAVGAYIAVALVLFVMQRGRWVRWYAAEFPTLYQDGEVGGGFFLFTCLAWPVAFPMFLAQTRATRQRESLLERYVKRGGR